MKITFDTALRAQNIGVTYNQEDTLWGYKPSGELKRNDLSDSYRFSKLHILCPTQEVLSNWIRENQNLHINVQPTTSFSKTVWFYDIIRISDLCPMIDECQYFDTYPEALEAALKKALSFCQPL
jgi:hypothetical protein